MINSDNQIPDAVRRAKEKGGENRMQLVIRNNPLACNESLCHVVAPRAAIDIETSRHPCHTPQSAQNQSLIDLKPAQLHCGKYYAV